MEDLKQKLYDLDEHIVSLINERYRVAMDRTRQGLPVPELTAADLERADLPHLESANSGPLPATALQAIYREILSGQLSLIRPTRVAFMGPEATFSHLATLRKFGESVTTSACQTIPDVFDEVAKGNVDYGVVPVENSTEGAVTVTFDLFYETSVKVYSEIYLRIHHYLLAKGDLQDVRVIYSHPQVFGQCRGWLQQNLARCELVEVSSTTAAAEKAAAEPHAAALAGLLAANKYGLRVLCENVEDLSENITRFLVLANREPEPTGDDKTSLMFAVEDRVGALYDSLLPFKEHGVNLTMIQSRPSKRKSWDYVFFADCLGHAAEPHVEQGIEGLSRNCNFVKILGCYPRAVEAV